MFTKKFDYNDINNFLPSNKTIGTVDFFNKKFKNNMPEHICELLSIETLIENEEKKEKMKKEILKKKNEYIEKLLKEYEERKEEGKTEEDKKEEDVNEIYDKYLTPKINNLTINNE